MRKLYIVAVLAALMAVPAAANAEVCEHTLTGAAIGAGPVAPLSVASVAP